MRFSTSGIFRQTIPLCPLIHGLKRFRIYIRIRGDMRLRKGQLLILFYCHGVSKKISYRPFLLYCCFNNCDKSRNIGVLTAKKLHAMMHREESRVCTMHHSFNKMFNLRLGAMQLSVKFKQKIFMAIPRYAV
jgi:hypothetical protein